MNGERSAGFTAIEAIVTLIVAVLFIITINVLFIGIIRATASTRDRSQAASVAYGYLRRYVYPNAGVSWFTCDSTTDVQANQDAPGQTLLSGSLSSADTSLGQPVTYKVTALAPFGCSGADKPPLLVRASVTYGADGITIDQATLLERP